MAKTNRSAPHQLSLFPPPDSGKGNAYRYVTQRPWPSLIFVLPMLVAFEVYTHARSTSSSEPDLVAEWLIVSTANAVGTSVFYFPAVLAIVILLAWHLAAKHSWRFDPWVLPGMLGESLIWTIPLFVYHRMLHQLTASRPTAMSAWFDQIIRSLGAGIYEELVFRLIAITLLVILLTDVMRLPRSAAAVFIILASAAIFSWSHHPPIGSEPYDPIRFFFRTGAGIYLACLFIFRGFGVAAGTHAFFNVIVVTIDAVMT